MNKLFSILLSTILISTQTFAFQQDTEYLIELSSIKNGNNTLLNTIKSNTIDYSNLLDTMNNQLFDTDADQIILKVVNKTINENLELKKKSEFIPKNTNTLINQEDSAFGKVYTLDYNDDDGMYVGFMENHLSSLSRGYYIKKYSEYDKLDGLSKDFIILGKANFVEDLTNSLYDYKESSKNDKIQPLLISYLNYKDTYTYFNNPNSYKENSFGWNGLINVNNNDNSKQNITNKLLSLSLPISSIQNRSFNTLTNGSNNLFLENGKVLQYKTNNYNEELFTHLSMANTFMANNNLKRSIFFKPSNSDNNFKFSQKKQCSGKWRKKCTYWQELNYTGGMDVFTSSFLDESYLDDWTNISYNNSDILTSSVSLPTIAPINSNAKLPSINSENYGYLYSTNYSGSIGGYGIYNYAILDINGLNGTTRHVKSDSYTVKGFGWLALLVSVISPIAFVYVYMNMFKGDSNYALNKFNPESNRSNSDTDTNLFSNVSSNEEVELFNSSTYKGLMWNSSNFDLNKNFMSNNFHNLASKYAKSDLTSINQNYFNQTIPILNNMDQQTKFWKSEHKNGIINGYKNSFFNDGKNASTGSEYGAFYSMKNIFRSIVKNYTNY